MFTSPSGPCQPASLFTAPNLADSPEVPSAGSLGLLVASWPEMVTATIRGLPGELSSSRTTGSGLQGHVWRVSNIIDNVGMEFRAWRAHADHPAPNRPVSESSRRGPRAQSPCRSVAERQYPLTPISIFLPIWQRLAWSGDITRIIRLCGSRTRSSFSRP